MKIEIKEEDTFDYRLCKIMADAHEVTVEQYINMIMGKAIAKEARAFYKDIKSIGKLRGLWEKDEI